MDFPNRINFIRLLIFFIETYIFSYNNHRSEYKSPNKIDIFVSVLKTFLHQLYVNK